MTGLYPWRTGFQQATTLMPGSPGHIPFNNPTIAEKLKSVGYNTQMIGKWHLYVLRYVCVTLQNKLQSFTILISFLEVLQLAI